MNAIDSILRNDLPLRKIIRVLIVKDGKICLGSSFDSKGRIRNYQYPGGGEDDGETPEQAAQRESLEEVGIRIKNIRPLHYNAPVDHQLRDGSRANLYRGTDTHYYIADFDCYDDSLLNVAGDKMPYEWLTPFEVWVAIDTGPNVSFNEYKLKALNKAWCMLGESSRCSD